MLYVPFPCEFQFTRPQGARLYTLVQSGLIFGFNSRARKGRDLVVRRRGVNLVLVSIHAPARGATRWRSVLLRRVHVSIHAPARGATLGEVPASRRAAVSIHAPARGATRARLDLPVVAAVSIHAPARGATPSGRVLSPLSAFQFTRPQGARRWRAGSRKTRRSFNSRARKGRDSSGALVRPVQPWFQFTRPQGARPPSFVALVRLPGFNSRARKGRDASGGLAHIVRVFDVSIHAPARGATLSSCAPCRGMRRFNSRARKGRDALPVQRRPRQ